MPAPSFYAAEVGPFSLSWGLRFCEWQFGRAPHHLSVILHIPALQFTCTIDFLAAVHSGKAIRPT